jgi:DNA polymerase-3 subunit gamma/tau
MSYQVLARKWRPRRFQDMIGQEHVLRMLTNALDQKRLHHAYLFTGTRGVGKTTLGRILAKCFNCETDVTSSPCGTCHTCKAIDAGHFLDLYEVDAASRTKVEDTRELLDNVLYAPSQGRYKVYLIDEAHMLSNHSFNALLKTLEEPPEHVKFVLATTDPKRLPATILSRCLQFHLKKITSEHITKHLQHICTEETVTHEIPALEQLAKAADGSMRDALSLLDQAIAYGQGAVNKNEVNIILGSMAQDDILPLLQAIATHDGSHLFNNIALLAERAPDFQQILEDLISILHQIAINQIVPNTLHLEESITLLAKQFTPEDVQLYYQIALLGKRDITLTPSPQQGFEMTMLRMLAFKPTITARATTAAIETTAPEPEKIRTANNENVAPPLSITSPVEWRDLLPKLGLSGMAYALAANCTLETMTENKVVLALSANHQPMLNQKLQERIAEAFLRHFKQPLQLAIIISNTELSTPIKQQQHEKKQQLDVATHSIMQDPKIKQLIDMYDATVEVSLLT